MTNTTVPAGLDAPLLARFGAKRIQADGELKVCFNPLDLAALLAHTRRAATCQPLAPASQPVDRVALGQVVDYQTAIDSVYPVPDSPHASVMQRAHDNRIAFSFGWQMANALAELAAGAGWTLAGSPPDADTTVMLALSDGEVWQGYWNGEDWIEVSGLVVTSRVKYWKHTPKHPEDQS